MPEGAPDLERGLDEAEVEARRARFGENAIEEVRQSRLRKVVSYFRGPIPWMIEAAAILAGVARRWEELAIIATMLAVNAGVGFLQEHKADTAIAALKENLALLARVLRDGRWRDVPARALVPGDVVLVRLGNIPADLELVGDGFLAVDQSALTGESLPVDKKAGDPALAWLVVNELAKLATLRAMRGLRARLPAPTTRSSTPAPLAPSRHP